MRTILPMMIFLLLMSFSLPAATTVEKSENTDAFAGLKLRNIGPALMSGRIADIAVDPASPSTWYVAAGSGGVWKTSNAGTTWTPIFEHEGAYSIGCITIDPRNSRVLWVGTGENVSGRHVGFGDGIYRSRDGGASWENMGLKHSEHISKIIIDAKNPRRIYVAAQGPLWTSGGERGVFRSIDGGKTWKKVLSEGPWTGATDLLLNPENPRVLYAALWQRHRSVAALMDGGPESGIYLSTDGGDNWEKLSRGLPEEDMGKIGLAMSHQDPRTLYAAIELKRRSGGIWKSRDGGSSWKKQSDTVSGATGPHYYQELVADPVRHDRIYLMDFRIRISDDGGKNFHTMPERNKHSDNHALFLFPGDTGHMLAGTDGGLYESYDEGEHWRFFANLPITQFYKVAVDDSRPFYNVYGGTQDNATQGGPSRTDNINGIRNSDWFITLFADGYQPAVEPGNPDIIYSEFQVGNLFRYDRKNGELLRIQPQAKPGEPPERFNWDAPILISPHSPTRLYYASQRVWKSEDRGNSWTPISSDLTRNEDRMLLPLMGRIWSYDAAWDLAAMSEYGTITSLAESPVEEGLIWAGTDDGLISVSEDRGTHWRRIETSSLPGAPERAFVNDIKADLFDADTVYALLDKHKSGDFSPYVYRSPDRGKHWENIRGDLPERTIAWRIVQDDEMPGLFFLGTEFGLFFSRDAGVHWQKLSGGVPTIAFRDLTLQRRDDDLVAASFGRGIWILDDYSSLREASEEHLGESGHLFPVRDAWSYIPRRPLGDRGAADQGAGFYVAPNPPFGAVFSYHLAKDLLSMKAQRRKKEKELEKAGKDTPYPGWKAIEEEELEMGPQILLIIRDQSGKMIRRIAGETTKGFHRVAWDLRFPRPDYKKKKPDPDAEPEPGGPLVPPGDYSVELLLLKEGRTERLSGPKNFSVRHLGSGSLPCISPEELENFQQDLTALHEQGAAMATILDETATHLEQIRRAVEHSTAGVGSFEAHIDALDRQLHSLKLRLQGGAARSKMGIATPPAALRRLGSIRSGTSFSSCGPTETQRDSTEIVREELEKIRGELKNFLEENMPALEHDLDAAGVPWTPGREIPE